ncbi:MAG: hydroxymyristoyl-ACP dehydratase [Clostridia bacterium]|nr:hydroxymyristoyl-ACP dehydratase [Clostridia bacterium]
MTNINCSANCVYQKDGKCCLENTSFQTVTPASDCAYFLKKDAVDSK